MRPWRIRTRRGDMLQNRRCGILSVHFWPGRLMKPASLDLALALGAHFWNGLAGTSILLLPTRSELYSPLYASIPKTLLLSNELQLDRPHGASLGLRGPKHQGMPGWLPTRYRASAGPSKATRRRQEH